MQQQAQTGLNTSTATATLGSNDPGLPTFTAQYRIKVADAQFDAQKLEELTTALTCMRMSHVTVHDLVTMRVANARSSCWSLQAQIPT